MSSIEQNLNDVVNNLHGQNISGSASVKNKLIDIIQVMESKTVDSNAPLEGIVDELHDAIINGSGGDNPQLYAPSILRSGDTIKISNPSTNGGFVDAFKIYNGNEVIGTQSSSSFSLIGLGKGNYELYVSATGEDFEESEKSNKIKASVYSITKTLENLTANDNTALISNGSSYTVTLTPASGKYLPEDIDVSIGGKSVGYEYNSYTGVITIPSVTGDIEIQAAALDTPKLRRPTLSLSGSTLTITPPLYAESTELTIDGVLIQTYTGTSAVTYDLSTDYSAYGIYDIKAKSKGTGYDDSEYRSLAYKVGATIAINNNTLTIVDIISGVDSFIVYVDDELKGVASYDGSPDWSLDMSGYEELVEDGKHLVELCALGTSIAENRSNSAVWFCGVAPIYGVSGMYDSNPLLTRTDDAVGMSFVINSSTGAVESDFDDVFPWSEAEIVDDTAGKFVKMPTMFFRVGVGDDNCITDIAVSAMPSGEGDWYEVPGFWYSCYLGYIESGKLVSKSGYTPAYSKTRAQFRSAAAANGDGYCQEDLYHATVMMFLWWIEFANKNSQAVMKGRESGTGTQGGSSRRNTGGTDYVATSSGFETSYGQMKWHGIEDWVGNMWRFRDGICTAGWNEYYHVTNDPTEFADDPTGMDTLLYKAPVNNGGCIAAYGWDENHPFMCMPCKVVNNGSYNTYFCDQLALNGSENPVLYCGSNCNVNYANFGLSCCNTYGVGLSNSTLGSRLLKLS